MTNVSSVAGIAVLAICLGSTPLVAKHGRAAKSCKSTVEILDPFGWFASCKSKFDKDGSDDVGGETTDRLTTRSKRLVWWIEGTAGLKIELGQFTNMSTKKPECPGTFTVNGKALKGCDILVSDGAGRQRVKLEVDSGNAGKIYKFAIVLTPSQGDPKTIDPELEIDTDKLLLTAVVVALMALLFLVAAVVAYRWWRPAR